MKSPAKKPGSEYRISIDNDLSLKWKKWDIIVKIILGTIGLLIAAIIPIQQLAINKRLSETSQSMENLRTEVSNRITQGQLASSLIEPLFKGSESERLAAMFILENSTSDSLSEIVLNSVALTDMDEKIRLEAIKVLEERGKSLITQKTLNEIKEKASSAKEREAATLAQQKVAIRARPELKRILDLARIYYKNDLYQSAAEEFKKIEDLLTDIEVDKAELALARVAYSSDDPKSAAEHYIKATEKIK